jgi:hypothetical protein
LADGAGERTMSVSVVKGEDSEDVRADDGRLIGRLVRRRRNLVAEVTVQVEALAVDGLHRLSVTVENRAVEPADTKAAAIARSFIGAHLIAVAEEAEFVSLLEPPDDAREAAATCTQRRCWPVLAGAPGQTDVVLASPIILYDYPEVAEQSAGALFDSTEIDEILTLRVMTLTDEEKAAARATDPRAAEIIDRCDSMSPEQMQALHGILRDPHAAADATSMAAFGAMDEQVHGAVSDVQAPNMDDVPTFRELPTQRADGDLGSVGLDSPPSHVPGAGGDPRNSGSDVRNAEPPTFDTAGAPWWDPAADASVDPESDSVVVAGVVVSKDSLVRLRPSRRADAQDLFFAGQLARVTAVLGDVDGQAHVAVVLVDDPAADMHEWYGRYLYFAPEELEPLGGPPTGTTTDHREESRS